MSLAGFWFILPKNHFTEFFRPNVFLPKHHLTERLLTERSFNENNNLTERLFTEKSFHRKKIGKGLSERNSKFKNKTFELNFMSSWPPDAMANQCFFS
jgi:hypothetical protein